MKNLKPYSKCTTLAFDLSIAKKHLKNRELLIANKIYVISKYNSFIALVPNLTSVPPFSRGRTLKDALLDAFENKTNSFKNILNEIRSSQDSAFLSSTCQYCGINESKSFDHYFPKDLYADLAIFPLNLIPACTYCNSIKGNEIYNHNGDRIYINFYYDMIENIPFLNCSIDYTGHIPMFNFSLDFSNISGASLVIAIDGHYTKLNLLDKYNKHVATYFEVIARDFKKSSLSNMAVKEIICRKINSSREVYGLNHHQTALLRAIYDSIDDFLVFVENAY